MQLFVGMGEEGREVGGGGIQTYRHVRIIPLLLFVGLYVTPGIQREFEPCAVYRYAADIQYITHPIFVY